MINKLNDSRTAFETATLFEQEKNYKDAIAQYSLVIEDDTNYAEAIEKITSCTNSLRDDVIASADEFVKNNDYKSALKTLRDGLKVLPDDSKITQSLTVYTETYVNDIISQAEAFINDKNLDEAESILNKALSLVSDNKTIKDKLEEVKNLRPVGLETVYVIDSKNYQYNSNGFVDSYGNEYSGVHYFKELIQSEEPFTYAIFNLNGEYTSFKGSIVSSEFTHSKGVFGINIYADGKQIYSKQGITKTTEKIDFNVDVIGCKKLEIRANQNDTSSVIFNATIGIVDAILEKM